ncbi:MAG: polysaccharide lyase [Dehalococcoidia bacterium]|nr:polysaccharide lyase [Dehalococcoidia bacterium]
MAGCATGLLALGAAALLGCRGSDEVSPAVLVDSVTYESGEQAQISLQASADDALTTTDREVREGVTAGVALLREGDGQFRGDLGYRSEWQSDFHAEEGHEYWYGISMYLPEDWDQGENTNFFDDRIIFQFHEGTGSSPALSLHINADQGLFTVRRRANDHRDGDDFEYLGSMPFETERWYDFAFHIKWSQDDDGFAHIFADGEEVRDYEGPTLVDGESVYTKWGIYGQPTRILIDEVRIAEGGEGGLALVSPSDALASED